MRYACKMRIIKKLYNYHHIHHNGPTYPTKSVRSHQLRSPCVISDVVT